MTDGKYILSIFLKVKSRKNSGVGGKKRSKKSESKEPATATVTENNGGSRQILNLFIKNIKKAYIKGVH